MLFCLARQTLRCRNLNKNKWRNLSMFFVYHLVAGELQQLRHMRWLPMARVWIRAVESFRSLPSFSSGKVQPLLVGIKPWKVFISAKFLNYQSKRKTYQSCFLVSGVSNFFGCFPSHNLLLKRVLLPPVGALSAPSSSLPCQAPLLITMESGLSAAAPDNLSVCPFCRTPTNNL